MELMTDVLGKTRMFHEVLQIVDMLLDDNGVDFDG